ncbi:hypothetical protein BCR35DRAFT_336092 [Leucosporidium creatinivorum]|uniref:Uncharacterized protein n=1 Tax=Leucosporidium creatinivorum TaxID=106004 RepID=A0A1Y2CR35_9BASI|nr:hypothetical protein BCR35DRAFT_336092 [Leucosporidium creatinivorum]
MSVLRWLSLSDLRIPGDLSLVTFFVYRAIQLVQPLPKLKLALGVLLYLDHLDQRVGYRTVNCIIHTFTVKHFEGDVLMFHLPEPVEQRLNDELLNEEDNNAIKAVAKEFAALDCLPVEQRRVVARAVSFALGEIDRLLVEGRCEEINDDEMRQVLYLPEWEKKIRRQYYYLYRALMIAEKREPAEFDPLHSFNMAPFARLRAWIKHNISSWIHIYHLGLIRTHRSADDPSSRPFFAIEALQPWKSAMLALVAQDDGLCNELKSRTLLRRLHFEFREAICEWRIQVCDEQIARA